MSRKYLKTARAAGRSLRIPGRRTSPARSRSPSTGAAPYPASASHPRGARIPQHSHLFGGSITTRSGKMLRKVLRSAGRWAKPRTFVVRATALSAARSSSAALTPNSSASCSISRASVPIFVRKPGARARRSTASAVRSAPCLPKPSTRATGSSASTASFCVSARVRPRVPPSARRRRRLSLASRFQEANESYFSARHPKMQVTPRFSVCHG
jgi:hypothetical protein